MQPVQQISELCKVVETPQESGMANIKEESRSSVGIAST